MGNKLQEKLALRNDFNPNAVRRPDGVHGLESEPDPTLSNTPKKRRKIFHDAPPRKTDAK